MKKIILTTIIAAQCLLAQNIKPTEYTVGNMLNKMYSSSDKIEELEKPKDFKYIDGYITDFNDKEKKELQQLYLYYMHRLKMDQQQYKNLTDKMIGSIDNLEELKNRGSYISLKDINHKSTNIISHVTYYVDFDNHMVYSKQMKDFVNEKYAKLYRIMYQVEYNRIIVFEPRTNKSNYFSIINLGETKSFTYSDLKEAIDYYMNKKNKIKE